MHETNRPMVEPDPYGEWVIRKVQQETDGNPGSLSEEVITAARAAWPRAVAHVSRELEREGSSSEAKALAADIWELVLRSVSKALHRRGNYASQIGDYQSYLLSAFNRRFHRFQKTENERREMFQTVSETLDLGLVEGAKDTEWVSEVERAITVSQITDRMDAWTKKAWHARQYGYSWKEISMSSGLSEQAAKKKFEYGLEKTRQKIVRLLKRGKSKGIA